MEYPWDHLRAAECSPTRIAASSEQFTFAKVRAQRILHEYIKISSRISFSVKRKVATSTFDSSDIIDSSDNVDELGHNPRPTRKKRNMLDTGTEHVATPPPKLNLTNTSSRIEYFPHIVVGEAFPLSITIRMDTDRSNRVAHPQHRFAEHESFWDMLGVLVADVQEAVGTEPLI